MRDIDDQEYERARDQLLGRWRIRKLQCNNSLWQEPRSWSASARPAPCSGDQFPGPNRVTVLAGLTEGLAIVAIAPMLFSTGVGSEIISAMALPVLGGLLIADVVVDIFLPVR